MIKISNSCLVDKSERNLQVIADFHLSKVNPLTKNNIPYKNSLANRLQSAKDKFSTMDYIRVFCGENVEHQLRLISFVDYFLCNDMENLNRVITSNPSGLDIIINEINEILIPSDWKNPNGDKTDFYNTISDNVFTYGNYRQSKSCIAVFKKLLGTQAQCFYCNNNKIDIVQYEENNNQMLFDLDHFYLKSKYPYLSLSFFNLIPCCSSCNSSVRGDIDFSNQYHINPYENCFNSEFIFKLEPEQIINLGLGYDDPFNIISIEKKEGSIRVDDRTIIDLRLVERYQNEMTVINNLAMKYRRNKHLQNSDSDLYIEMIYGYQYCDIPQDLSNIPRIQLAKLKYDVLSQLSGED